MASFANYQVVEHVRETLDEMATLCSTRLEDNPCGKRKERVRHPKPNAEVIAAIIIYS